VTHRQPKAERHNALHLWVCLVRRVSHGLSRLPLCGWRTCVGGKGSPCPFKVHFLIGGKELYGVSSSQRSANRPQVTIHAYHKGVNEVFRRAGTRRKQHGCQGSAAVCAGPWQVGGHHLPPAETNRQLPLVAGCGRLNEHVALLGACQSE